jgi:Flp pilus assembly protein TadG
MRLRPQVRGRRRAAAAVELAVLLPFLVLAFLVAVDFCRVFHATQTVQGSAEAAALYASGTALPPAGSTPADAATQAALAEAAALDPPLQPGAVSIVTDSTAKTVTVTVTYPFQTLVPYPGLGQTLTLQRSACVVQAPQAGEGPAAFGGP